MSTKISISFIIPVFNRPEEIRELLESFKEQETQQSYEIVIVEDGSSERSEAVIDTYASLLNISYFFKENSGPGDSRNYGMRHAKGNYFIILDSDCILPKHYVETAYLKLEEAFIHCFGGPDAAHASFSNLQKAINYSMTSFLTTGGIRGGKKQLDKFQPRSFNMGISKKVYQDLGGYAIPRLGEDLEYSLRIIKAGYKTDLISDAFVFHKRRTDLRRFYNQLHFFGRSRINVYRFYPDQLKIMHWFPFAFLVYCLTCMISLFVGTPYVYICLPLLIWTFGLFIDALINEKNLQVALVSIIAAFIQLNAYGVGFITDLFKFKILGIDPAANDYPS